MHPSHMSLLVHLLVALPLLLFAGVGAVYAFFTRQLRDWHIRQLQKTSTIVVWRLMGILFMAVGLFFAWTVATLP